MRRPAGGAAGMTRGGLPKVPHRRGVRSFVRRAGRVTKAQRKALDELWPRYGIEAVEVFDPGVAFGREAPLVLEIGFGMGEALVTMARANPEKNYLGVDVYPPGIGSALNRIHAEALDNVRLVRADAEDFLPVMADSSLDSVLVFFPDPWPKKRHHKRRLIQPEFVEQIYRKLKPAGRFELATDWSPYAEEMLELVSAHGGFVNLAGNDKFAPRPEQRPVTKFERRGEKLGHPIFDLLFARDCGEHSGPRNARGGSIHEK